MNIIELLFFGLCALFALVGGIATVAARNPLRGAMGLLSTIIGIAGLYLMLSAELLAAVQVIVYAGAVVVLFVFVIMLLGPSASSSPDARSAVSRYLGAGAFLVLSAAALGLLASIRQGELTAMAAPPAGYGGIDAFGAELFSKHVVPFELAGVLLLIAVVGAVAVARGKQNDPTLGAAPKKVRTGSTKPASIVMAPIPPSPKAEPPAAKPAPAVKPAALVTAEDVQS